MRRLILLMFLLCTSLAAALPGDGLVQFVKPLNTSAVRVFDDGFGPTVALPAQAGRVTWVDAASSPLRQEYMTVEIREGGIIVAQVFRDQPYASKILTTTMGGIAADYKGASVTYDSSGRAMIVYANDSTTARYELWNGTDFIGGESLISGDACRGTPRWIDLAADPNTNGIMMVELDTTASHCTQYWNGSAWTNPHFLVDTDLLSSVGPRIDVAFNNESEALVLFESDARGQLRYARWTGSWSSSSSVSWPTDRVSWVHLTSQGKTFAATTYAKTNSTARVGRFNGSWRIDTVDTMLSGSKRPIDIATGMHMSLVYVDNTSNLQWATCPRDCVTPNWTITALNVSNVSFAQVASYGNNSLVGITDGRSRVAHSRDWSFTTLGMATYRAAGEDLAVRMDRFNDTLPPEVRSVAPMAGSNESAPLSVKLDAMVIDYGIVDTVVAQVQDPNGSLRSIELNGSVSYSAVFLPTVSGIHNVTIRANDTAGHVNASVTSWFNYTFTPPEVSIIAPTTSSFSNGTTIALRGNATESEGTLVDDDGLAWYSDLDGVLGVGNNLSVTLSVGVHTLTLQATDRRNVSANASLLVEFFPDRDHDGLADTPDTLEGNESWITTEGIEQLEITVDNNSTIMGVAFLQERNVSFLDNNETLLTVHHNFSLAEMDLSGINLTLSSTQFLMQASALENDTKEVFFPDTGLTSLCSHQESATSDCSGANETDLTACLDASIVIDGISCRDDGDMIILSNLTKVYVTGDIPDPAPRTSSSDSSGDGSNQYEGPVRVPRKQSSNTEAPSPATDSGSKAPKEASQQVVPKAPEPVPEKPVAQEEERSTTPWWIWVLAVIGILLTVFSFLHREEM